MKLFIAILLSAFAAATALQAKDRVVPQTKRVNLLKKAEKVEDVSDPELQAQLEDVRYPFEFKPEPVKVVVNTPEGPIIEPEPERVITKEEVLEEFASRLKPTGVLFKEGQGVMILSGGKQLLEGRVYRVNYEGKPFDIMVAEVTATSYTLNIDDASVTRQLDSDAGRGVTRD